MSQNFCLVYYYIPQDQDDSENPNAFGLNVAKENVTMRDIRKAFPLEGKYIFRFKYKIQNQTVWMDANSDDAKVPQFNNRIFIKATRVDWGNEIKMGDLPNVVKMENPVAAPKIFSAQNLEQESPTKQASVNLGNLLDF